MKSGTRGVNSPLENATRFRHHTSSKSKEVQSTITFRAGENTEISRIFRINGVKFDKEFALCDIEQNVYQSMLFVSPKESSSLLQTNVHEKSGFNTRKTEYVRNYRIEKGFKGNTFLNLEALIGRRVSFTKKQYNPMTSDKRSIAPIIFTGILKYSKDGVLVIFRTNDKGTTDNHYDLGVSDDTGENILEIFNDQDIESIRVESSNKNSNEKSTKYDNDVLNGVMPVSDKLLVTIGRRNKHPPSEPLLNYQEPPNVNKPLLNSRVISYPPDESGSENDTSDISDYSDNDEEDYPEEHEPLNLSQHVANTLYKQSEIENASQEGATVVSGNYLVEYDTNQITSSAVYQFELDEEGNNLLITMKLVVENRGNISYDDANISMVVDVQGDETNSIYDQVTLPNPGYGRNYQKRAASKSYRTQENYEGSQQILTLQRSQPVSSYSESSEEVVTGGSLDINDGENTDGENQMQNIIDLSDKTSIRSNDTTSITFFDRLRMNSKIRNFYEAKVGSTEFQTELVWYKGKENFPGGTVNVYQVQSGGTHKISRGDFVIRSIGSSKRKVKNLLGKALGLSGKWKPEGVTSISDHEDSQGNSKENEYKYTLTVTNQKPVDTEVFIKATFEGAAWRSIGKDITFERENVPRDERSKNSAFSGIATLIIPKNTRKQYTALIRVPT